MKFSYRLCTSIFLSVILVVWLYLYGRAHITSLNSKSLTPFLWPEKHSDINIRIVQSDVHTTTRHSYVDVTNFSHQYVDSECKWVTKAFAEVDIKTSDLLAKVNKQFLIANPAIPLRHAPISLDHMNDALMDQVPGVKRNGKKLKIIVLPHSHSDPGWQKTLEQYFDDQTQPTLKNMLNKLEKYPKMTFIWAESVFLELWWRDLTMEDQERARALIAKGKLEMAVGSWVVPDEANTHYFALIDQMIEGHQWLEKNLGVKPNYTWSLDPFGYSSGLPYLYKRAGYNSMVILRVNRHIKKILQENKSLEYYWQQPWDSTGSTKMFTLMMPYMLYNIKNSCGPDPHICLQFDFRKIIGEQTEARAPLITKANVDRQAKLLLSQYQKKADLYKHNVVLIPLGDDFRYDRDIEWDQQFKNYMYLFNYINAKSEWNVEAKFGTLNDYFNEVRNEMNTTDFPTLSGDFFPYTDEKEDYWTGYFTSRPYDKLLGREVEAYLRSADIIHSYASIKAELTHDEKELLDMNINDLEEAHRSLGLFQHHDAITGTSKYHVVRDYESRLWNAISQTQSVIQRSTNVLQGTKVSGVEITVDNPFIVKKDNIVSGHEMKVLKSGNSVIFYNSIGQQRAELARLIVNTDMVNVLDDSGKIVVSQINPVWIDEKNMAADKYELLFHVELPPLAMKTYTVTQVDTLEGSGNYAAVIRVYNMDDFIVPANTRLKVYPPTTLETILLENEAYRVRFSQRTGLMHSITKKKKVPTATLR